MEEEKIHKAWVEANLSTGLAEKWGKIMYEARDTHGLGWNIILEITAKVEQKMWEDFVEYWNSDKRKEDFKKWKKLKAIS